MSSLDLCSLLGAAHRTARGLGPLVDVEECVASGVLRGIPAFRKSVDALIASTAHLGLAAANLRKYLDIIVELCHLLFDPLPTRPPDPTPVDDDMTPAQQEIKEHLTCCSALRPKLQSTTCGDGSNPDLFIIELKPTLMCARVSLPSAVSPCSSVEAFSEPLVSVPDRQILLRMWAGVPSHPSARADLRVIL